MTPGCLVIRRQCAKACAACDLHSLLSDGMLTSRTRSSRRTFTCAPGSWCFDSLRLRCVSAMAAMMATSSTTAAISNG